MKYTEYTDKHLDLMAKNMPFNFAIIEEENGMIHFIWKFVKTYAGTIAIPYMVSDISQEYCKKMLIMLFKNKTIDPNDDDYIDARCSWDADLDFKRIRERNKNKKARLIADNNGWYGFLKKTEENAMIKERCFLDLLKEEKKAVSEYNGLIDDCEFTTSHYTELAKEHPEMKEFSDML